MLMPQVTELVQFASEIVIYRGEVSFVLGLKGWMEIFSGFGFLGHLGAVVSLGSGMLSGDEMSIHLAENRNSVFSSGETQDNINPLSSDFRLT